MKRFRLFLINVLIFGGLAAGIPFLVIFYQNSGFTGPQIGLLTGITPLMTLVGIPIWTNLADTTGKHRQILGVAFLVGSSAVFLLPFLSNFFAVFITVSVFSAFFGSVTAFIDNATMVLLEDQRDLYGRIRLGGTVGYGIAALSVGIIVENFGLRYAFWVSALLWMMALLISRQLVFEVLPVDLPVDREKPRLVLDWRWLLLLALAFLGGVGLSLNSNYFYPYLRGLGAPESVMGLTVLVGNLAEVPVLFFGNRLIRRFQPFGLLVLGIGITGMRLLLLGVIESVNLVFLLQLIGGFTFIAMWIAGVAYADKIAAPGMGTTAQGYFSAMVFGFGPAVGGFAGGLLLESAGPSGIFQVFGVMILGMLLMAVVTRRIMKTKRQPSMVP